ncbi:hypothetical protein HWV62_17712 [Athelia sp. TMB]|nr:hypothetical protein HWV62_17712 [Athelia sp. TMB]
MCRLVSEFPSKTFVNYAIGTGLGEQWVARVIRGPGRPSSALYSLVDFIAPSGSSGKYSAAPPNCAAHRVDPQPALSDKINLGFVMDAYPGVTPLWDLSQATTFSQLPDDDFLALLQKQFPGSADFNTGVFQGGINPQEIQPFSLPGLSPPSDDSSPSPQSANQDRDDGSRSRSRHRSGSQDDDPMLKRKASDDSLDEEPNQKNQHTSGDKRSNNNRRKSTGDGDGHLVKVNRRKEQNRAAQRAFRERKEKHVKDLEDKVAELEAKNEQATSENVNLRDLLTRLQDENVTLKQAAFTFSVPKPQTQPLQQPVASGSNHHLFSPSASSSSSSSGMSSMSPISHFSPPPTALAPTHSVNTSPMNNMNLGGGDMDWTSLTTFDPAVLSLLDESPPPEPTATSAASSMFTDFGFGGNTLGSQFTTIAANPQFMSFADFDSPASGSDADGGFNFDMWAQPDPHAFSPPRDSSLDDLFGGNGYAGDAGLVDFNALMAASAPSLAGASPGMSPVVHQAPAPRALASGSSSSSASASASMPSSAATSPEASGDMGECGTTHGDCPKTKEEIARAVLAGGPSSIVTAPVSPQPGDAVMAGGRDELDLTKVMSCKGTGFPKTDPKPDNVEVLAAWRGITSAAGSKDYDINQLCSEFSSKAKCDGTKVVLDQSTYQSMLQKLAQARQQQK